MLNLIKKGKKYILQAVRDTGEKIFEYTMNWEEYVELFCQISETVCNVLGEKKTKK